MRQRARLLVSVKVLALYVNEGIRMYLACNKDFASIVTTSSEMDPPTNRLSVRLLM
jgi:hypothetical protein